MSENNNNHNKQEQNKTKLMVNKVQIKEKEFCAAKVKKITT